MFTRDPFFRHQDWSVQWPFVFIARSRVQLQKLSEVEAWCLDQFGEPGERWTMYGWRVNILNPSDATAFMVRWV